MIFVYLFRWFIIREMCFLFCFQSFLHISTLYSNCNRKVIEEKVYEQEMGYEKIIEVGFVFTNCNINK